MNARTQLDFMSRNYTEICEPLNLLAGGQRWFGEVYDQHLPKNPSVALVLGATPWLGALCAERHAKVVLSDQSAAMLQHSQSKLAGKPGRYEFSCRDWLSLDTLSERVSTVCADNSFAFLPYPDKWKSLLDTLAALMEPGGLLLSRFFARPNDYRPESPREIAADARSQTELRFTEIRARVMFSYLDPLTNAMSTEDAVRDFERDEAMWREVLDGYPENDLVNIKKYKGTGIRLYAPPVEDIVRALSPHFDVAAVEYGPYGMSRHFPLVAATRRP